MFGLDAGMHHVTHHLGQITGLSRSWRRRPNARHVIPVRHAVKRSKSTHATASHDGLCIEATDRERDKLEWY